MTSLALASLRSARAASPLANRACSCACARAINAAPASRTAVLRRSSISRFRDAISIDFCCASTPNQAAISARKSVAAKPAMVRRATRREEAARSSADLADNTAASSRAFAAANSASRCCCARSSSSVRRRLSSTELASMNARSSSLISSSWVVEQAKSLQFQVPVQPATREHLPHSLHVRGRFGRAK